MDAQMCFLKVSVAKIINTSSVTNVSFLFGLNTFAFDVILNTSGKIWHTTKYYSDGSSTFHKTLHFFFVDTFKFYLITFSEKCFLNKVLFRYVPAIWVLWSYNCVCRTWVTSTPSTNLLNPTWRGRTGQRRERSSTCSLWRIDRNWYTTLYLYV